MDHLKGDMIYLEEAEFPEEVTYPVSLLTHEKGVPYMEYVEGIKKSEVAVAVKKADLRNNMDLSRIPNPTEKDLERVRKYIKAYESLNN